MKKSCRGDTRPARGSKLTLLSKRFARTVDGYHPSKKGARKKIGGRSSAARHLPGVVGRQLRCRAARFARGMGPDKVWQHVTGLAAARLLSTLPSDRGLSHSHIATKISPSGAFSLRQNAQRAALRCAHVIGPLFPARAIKEKGDYYISITRAHAAAGLRPGNYVSWQNRVGGTPSKWHARLCTLTKSIACKLSRDFSFSSFPGA